MSTSIANYLKEARELDRMDDDRSMDRVLCYYETLIAYERFDGDQFDSMARLDHPVRCRSAITAMTLSPSCRI